MALRERGGRGAGSITGSVAGTQDAFHAANHGARRTTDGRLGGWTLKLGWEGHGGEAARLLLLLLLLLVNVLVVGSWQCRGSRGPG